jgi:16S rRNA (cytosine967-C5)-methyltransferase
VIDLCAAPGGKTAQLAAGGGEVIAVEKNAKRAPRLTQNLERLGLKAEIVVADAGTWTPAQAADVVLLDAPCSATGTLRRHPDIAHNKDAVDIATLARAQARLLDAAAGMVAPGGLLIYCTCSLEPEEGEAQVQPFLARNPEFKVDAIGADEIGGRPEAITADGTLRTRPDQGWDGFFAVRFKRAA